MAVHNGVADIVAELQERAAERRPDDELLKEFLPIYYRELPEDDAEERSVHEMYGSAVQHLALGRVRAPGERRVEVVSPDYERDGWHSDRSVLLFITDDVPQALDTLSQFTGAPTDVIADSPFALVGTTDRIAELLLERRERWGFSYVIVGQNDVEPFAPVVAALSGT